MSDTAVLVVSTKVDLATDAVVQRLRDRNVRCIRLNTEDFPFQNTLAFYPDEPAAGGMRFTYNGEQVQNPTSIWYRRLRSPGTPNEMDEGIAAFCRQETRAALVGGLVGRSARWMSHPSAIWQAEFKPYQLQLAASMGLRIPRTVVSNDPVAIRSAFSEFGDMIVKPTRSGYIVKGDAEYAIYTSQLLEEHMEHLESARWSPSIYQALVPKKYDVRVTVVGTKCFAARIDSRSDVAAHIDWRQTENSMLPHFPLSLPHNLETDLLLFMGHLGLTFGAIDLVETPDGGFVFLEVNPNGQWLWIDDALDLGISDAVSEWLAGENNL